ncbi:hypothetical protein FPCIR_2902 [Fusarium pseudocircinatum]|uniref:C2H2-type domain-containing protein n=1 Tax=Fusarium pseudocircinatum TaxID=56676 RepID=A0A8H5PKM3_9HYPO|nr:hypothetical protein FPCIR_2902 [Fusarium pseudocircinatum]
MSKSSNLRSTVSQNKSQLAPTNINEHPSSLRSNEDDFIEVEDALEQLYRLATAIKRSSRKTIEQRASEFAQNVELEPVNKLFTRIIECLYPQIDRSLQNLLSMSMFDRFTMIIYLGTRQATLAARHVEQRSLPTISEERQDTARPGPKPGSLEKSMLNYSPPVQTRNRSLATPTSLSPSKLWQHLNVGVSNLDLNKTTSIGIYRRSYPPPPEPQRQEPRLCEWCGEPFKSRDMDPVHWRQHIDNDLKPYICLAEHCTIAVGYSSFREWSSHMQQHSETWYRTVYSPATYLCPLCIDNMSSFASRDELLQHLTSEHQSGTLDDGRLSIIAGQSQGIKERPKDECLLCGFVVENEGQTGVPSKRQGESRSEGKTKKQKTERRQATLTETFSSSKEEEGPNHEAINHESMARHIAAHLQTLMFLTLRVILTQKDLGSEDEDAAESHTRTNDVQDYQSSHDLDDPPSSEDASHRLESPWLPAAETFSFNFDIQERAVFRYPTIKSEDIIDTSIQLPDSLTVQETIIRLEALLATTEQNGGFYNSLVGLLESARNLEPPREGISYWICVSY